MRAAADPRERIETGCLRCEGNEAGWHISHWSGTGREDWSGIVAFARAILAANEQWLDSQTVKSERQFPVLGSRYRPGSPRSVPWSMLAPHEPQALKNHCGQSLELLASRGGLSPAEIYAVVNGLSWSVGKSPCDEASALHWLAAKLEEPDLYRTSSTSEEVMSDELRIALSVANITEATREAGEDYASQFGSLKPRALADSIVTLAAEVRRLRAAVEQVKDGNWITRFDVIAILEGE